MKTLALIAALTLPATGVLAADKYTLDASHSQIVFSYDHLGFSTTYGMFSGFEGEIMFDEAAPEASSVTVSMPVTSMFTGWEKREGHFLSPDLINAAENALVSFASTGIEVTGENTAKITGDLSFAGTTKSVVLDAVMNKADTHPMAGKPWMGFDATTTLMRTDFGVGMAVPVISDEVKVMISIEAQKAE